MFELNSQTPFQLRNETRSINTNTTKNGNSITISWNIPEPLNGPASSYRAYNGIVIVGSTRPITEKLVDLTVYTADPTMNFDVHVGDKIVDDVLVVGAFYNDTTTTSLIVSDCTLNVYYFYLFPVNKHLHYDDIGIASYELKLQNDSLVQEETRGYHTLKINNSSVNDNIAFARTPVVPEHIKIYMENTEYDITYNPTVINTYSLLIDYINNYFKNTTADYVSTVPYNRNVLWFTNNKLYKWDGYEFIPQTIYVQTTQPHIPSTGDYWLNNTSLKKWNGSWQNVNFIQYDKQPDQINTNTVWFDGTDAYQWNGTYWLPVTLYNQTTDPHATPNVDGVYWLNGSLLYFITNNTIVPQSAIVSDYDPTIQQNGYFWVNLANKTLKKWLSGAWTNQVVTFGKGCDLSTVTTAYYYDTSSHQLFDIINNQEVTNFIVWNSDPTVVNDGQLWLDGSQLYIRLNNTWNQVPLLVQTTNPTLPQDIGYGSLWLNNTTMKTWVGNTWADINYINKPTDPLIFVDGVTLWFNTSLNKLFLKTNSGWQEQTKLTISNTDPTTTTLGEFWMNNTTLQMWNGIGYVSVLYQTNNPEPAVGFKWYNNVSGDLKQWTGSKYNNIDPICIVSWNDGLVFTDTKYGGDSAIMVTDYSPINAQPQTPILGIDSVSRTPMMYEQNIGGNDGSIDERLEVVDSIKRRLGHPVFVVELTDAQMNDAIDRALRVLRVRSSVAYNKMVMLLQLKPIQNKYILSNKKLGYNRIVDIMQIHRLPSSFLTAVGSQQIYGQLVLQQLYQAGSFDLVSYHLISNYIELLEKMFASKITFNWYERTRELIIYNTVGKDEIVLLEVMVERTENDLLTDRRLRDWLERYALSECREMLADIRGKFSSLPGPGGGISLNSSDMREAARTEKEQCMLELESYIVEQPEEIGGPSTFIMG